MTDDLELRARHLGVVALRIETDSESETPLPPKELTMLLSRVAESVYWSGRYLERAEATARLIKIHTEMYLDLPLSAGIGWSPLLAVTGSREAFERRSGDALRLDGQNGPELRQAQSQAQSQGQHLDLTEDAIIRFLATDADSPASILSSVSAARTNFRVTRAVFPNASWEEMNRLFLWIVESRTQAVDRRTRLFWMERVIRDCQVLRGLMSSTMSHDAAYSFVEIGRAIECADMTTRVLDVQAGVLLAKAPSAARDTYGDITWAAVLKSVSANQMFRRTVRSGISGPDALQFLLRDPQFPRSVEHCLTRIARSLIELPRFEHAMAGCAQVQELLVDAQVSELAADGLHEYVDQLQIGIGRLHDAITATYFVRPPAPSVSASPRTLPITADELATA